MITKLLLVAAVFAGSSGQYHDNHVCAEFQYLGHRSMLVQFTVSRAWPRVFATYIPASNGHCRQGFECWKVFSQ